MRYYIADLHFFHSNINDRLDKRGFSNVEEMNEFLVKQWNSRVKSGDEVVIIGDISFGNAEQTNAIVRRLNGKKYLIKGNHDHKFLKDRNFDHSLFVSVKEYDEMNDNGRRVVLCHYPILFYNGQYRTLPDGKPATYMLSGHIHDTQDMRLLEKVKELYKQFTFERNNYGKITHEHIPFHLINCFCKYSNYVPLTLDEWIALQDN